jgi:hypothetical protein
MKAPQVIYAIQEQGSLGAWELTGHFFTVDKEAYAYVDKKNLESVIESIDDFSNARKELAKWTETDFEEVKVMDSKEISDLLKTIPDGLIGEFADELQMGGFFSYEVLGNCDGKNPE